MRNPLSDKVVQMKPSGIRKFFDLVQEMPDAISLGVGEPDFDTPWHIREEGIYSLEKGRTFYTSNAGLLELRKAIAHYMYRKYELTYNPAHEIVVTVGGSEGIDLALRAMLNPGDEVILPEPAFVSYLPCVKLADGVPVTIDLKEENHFKLKPEELLAAITDKTKILILSYPNNPTGAIMTREDLEPIAEIVKEKDLYVISDEIYAELSYEDEFCSIASFDEIKVCTAYKDVRDGKIYTSYPEDVFIHKYLEPVYETHKGWNSDITGVREYEKLPENARKYLERLEVILETPISIVSVGPDRDQTIFKK